MKSQTKLSRRAVAVADLPQYGILIMVGALTLGVGALVLADIKEADDGTSCSAWTGASGQGATNCTASDLNISIDYGISSLKELGSWFDTIAVVIAAVIILGLIFLLFRSGRI